MITVPFNDIEISKMNQLIEDGQGFGKKTRCSCGRHDRIDFYLIIEVE